MNFFIKYASVQRVIIFFILATSVYAIMLLITIPDLIHYSGGYQVPDMLPLGYESGYISELFTRLGQEGRDAYLYRQIPYDMLYPAFFALCYSLLLTLLLKQFKTAN
ncbi:MAG: hypothetical protein KDD94_14710, partial [Calditrichaeota bacterium]|nr:hypothetical protein [Calditrichota bacterium]